MIKNVVIVWQSRQYRLFYQSLIFPTQTVNRITATLIKLLSIAKADDRRCACAPL
ncbi:hypothetical protein RVIR1_11180 [Candidatus Rickettsiella viridis]|uniref:Uncharacterized protein n=1 Tax=Candidatus Rickettsiella viridis TaxID=676208 RepID=A0A2Z5UVD1_9COXI|nr:hypothetical protein RVIR1_11180 [Candidatus Rickettsiella viridis]